MIDAAMTVLMLLVRHSHTDYLHSCMMLLGAVNLPPSRLALAAAKTEQNLSCGLAYDSLEFYRLSPLEVCMRLGGAFGMYWYECLVGTLGLHLALSGGSPQDVFL